MRWKPHPTPGHDPARSLRAAAFGAFLATLALLAILALARSANADPGPASAPAAAPFLGEEAEECEEEECAFEFEEECEAGEAECEEEAEGEAPPECVLTEAEASVFAYTGRDRVRLVVHYTATRPTTVALSYGLHGGKGALFMGASHVHLARRGTLRETAVPSDAKMAKVLAAKDFSIRLAVPSAPHSCHSYFDHELTVRHAAPGGLLWSQVE